MKEEPLKLKGRTRVISEQEYNIYVKGFEDGYATAKRIYKPVFIVGTGNGSNYKVK